MSIRSLFLLLPLLLLISCEKEDPRYEAEDERNPLFKEAQEAIHDRDYEKAVKSYEAALRKNPKAAAAHYEIGMLYSEKLGDPIKTIYHLQSFLEERPNTDKAELAKGHLENAKITFAATLPNSPVQNAELFAKIQSENLSLKKEREDLYKKLTEMEGSLTSTKEEHSKMLTQLEEEKVKSAKALEEANQKAAAAAAAAATAVATVASPVISPEQNSANNTDRVNPVAVPPQINPSTNVNTSPTTSPNPTVPTTSATSQAAAVLNPHSTTPTTIKSTPTPSASVASTVASPSTSTTPSGSSTTYVIQKGDTLWKISKKHYPKDVVNGIERIKNANQETLHEGKPLKIGTTLVIP